MDAKGQSQVEVKLVRPLGSLGLMIKSSEIIMNCWQRYLVFCKPAGSLTDGAGLLIQRTGEGELVLNEQGGGSPRKCEVPQCVLT